MQGLLLRARVADEARNFLQHALGSHELLDQWAEHRTLPQQLLQSLLSFSKISILLPLDQITWVSERVRMVSRLLSSASACCRLLHPARMPREQETE